MRRDQARFALLSRFVEHAARPPGKGKKILAPGGAADPASPAPGSKVLREPLGYLSARQALPKAVVTLAEPRGRNDSDLARLRGRDDPGRFKGTAQIAGVDRLQGDGCQPKGQGLGLCPAVIVQGDIGLSLNPPILVPFRLAVADQIDD